MNIIFLATFFEAVMQQDGIYEAVANAIEFKSLKEALEWADWAAPDPDVWNVKVCTYVEQGDDFTMIAQTRVPSTAAQLTETEV